MFKQLILKNFYRPNLCNKINVNKYPWGWKSINDIEDIINYPITNHNINFNNSDRKFIHEYRLREYTEDLYLKTYYAYLNNYNFLNSGIHSLNLANALNHLRSVSNVESLPENIKIKNIEILNSWIKNGNVMNKNKFFGYYDYNQVIHEISAGVIGPEIQGIWDQKSIKQKARVLIEYNNKKDIIDLERDLMTKDNLWQLCNINRIIL